MMETKRLLLREMIGDCGLTLQNINGELLPEIGFHIRHDCQRKGYAKEAARAVRDWAFRNTDYPAMYSYCKYTNEPSFRTAEAIGMRFACEYPDEINGRTHVSVISREEWLNKLTENMVSWGHCGISLGNSKIIHAWDTVRLDDYREIEAMTALSGDHPRYIGWARTNCTFRLIPQKSHRRHTVHLDAVSQKKSMRNWQQRSPLMSKWNTEYKREGEAGCILPKQRQIR